MSGSKYSRITGYGYFVPPKVLSNKDLEKMVDTTDEWITTRTGIRERRIAENVGVSDLAAKAALRAIEEAGVSPEQIDLIVCATSTPDTPLPSTACYVQAKIGARRAACFDLAAACAGFVYALTTADQFIKTGAYKKILVIGADMISPYVDWSDRGTCVLFGDGAGAVILEPSDEPGIMSSELGSSGEHAELLLISAGGSRMPASEKTVADKQHYLKMNGKEVFKLAVRGMGESALNAIKAAGIEKAQVKCLIPHQANKRIIEAIRERLELPEEKVFVNLEKYGNTSAASCIIALCEARQSGVLKKGDIFVLATFGAGLVWGSMVIKL